MSLQPLCPKQKKGPMTAPPPHFSDQLGGGEACTYNMWIMRCASVLRACECATIRGTRTRDGHGHASTPSERRIKKAQRAMDGGINAGQLIVRGKEKKPHGGGRLQFIVRRRTVHKYAKTHALFCSAAPPRCLGRHPPWAPVCLLTGIPDAKVEPTQSKNLRSKIN